MGIYGALQTAVSGLRAQSHAMENISGNIANSQTTGYKRIETSFVDLIPDAPVKNQTPGAVMSYSRSTNGDRGDIQNASTETYMALNGSGFFVVEPSVGDTSGTYYTRRGDFDLDKNGFLVNGAGFKLKGVSMDNGVVTGSVPQAIKIDNSFLPAKRSTTVDYKLNLPQLPKNGAYVSTTPGSELLKPWSYAGSTGVQQAGITGAGAAGNTDADLASTIATAGDKISVTVGGIVRTYEFGTAATVAAGNIPLGLTATDTIGTTLAAIELDLRNNGGAAAAGATASIDNATGQIKIDFVGNYDTPVSIAGTGTAVTNLGMAAATSPAPSRGSITEVKAADADRFMKESITGGGITIYSKTGEPINLQVRWTKTSNAAGNETWSMFYASDTRPGAATPWTKVADYSFDQGVISGITGNSTIVPPSTQPFTTKVGNEQVVFSNLQVNGTDLGSITIDHGLKGITQFADNGGTATTTALKQNGFGAGEFLSVGINDSGRVVASYSNGETREVAQIVVANFNAPDQLKRGDGGTYTATSASGEPVLSENGGIVGSSLEASNTDISEEFTKLIVTQQAYSANTRIVSAANDMLKETLSMIR